MKRSFALDSGARGASAGKKRVSLRHVSSGAGRHVHLYTNAHAGVVGKLAQEYTSSHTSGGARDSRGQEPPQRYPLGLAQRSRSTGDGACKRREGALYPGLSESRQQVLALPNTPLTLLKDPGRPTDTLHQPAKPPEKLDSTTLTLIYTPCVNLLGEAVVLFTYLCHYPFSLTWL